MDSSQELRAKAERYRRMAATITDSRTLQALHELAAHYEAVATALEEGKDATSPPADPPT